MPKLMLVALLYMGVLLIQQSDQARLADCLVKTQIWVKKDLKWQKPPKEVGSKTEYTIASLLVFGPDGAFVKFTSALIKQVDGSFRIGGGDGFALQRGVWQIVEKTGLQARFRLVDAFLLPEGATLPSPEEVGRGDAGKVCKGSLTLQGSQYEAMKRLHEDDRESLLYRLAEK